MPAKSTHTTIESHQHMKIMCERMNEQDGNKLKEQENKYLMENKESIFGVASVDISLLLYILYSGFGVSSHFALQFIYCFVFFFYFVVSLHDNIMSLSF